MTQGKFIRFEAPGKVVFLDFDLPQLRPGEVLIENEFSAVSAGTELANLVALPNTNTAREGGFPMVPGYSAVGKVAAVGDGVENVCVGDRVINAWSGHRSHAVKKAAALIKVPDEVKPLEASMAVIASFAMYGLRKLRVEIGESVMVAGLGILGAFAVQMARLAGALPVLAADFDQKRRQLAERIGADLTLTPDDDKFNEKILAATDGRGVDAIVEVTGSAAALRQALEYVAFGGRVSLLGCTRVSDAAIDFYKYVHRRGISIIGTHTHTRPKLESAPGEWTEEDDCRTFLKLVAAKRIQVLPMLSEVVPAREAPLVYQRLLTMKPPPMGIAFAW